MNYLHLGCETVCVFSSSSLPPALLSLSFWLRGSREKCTLHSALIKELVRGSASPATEESDRLRKEKETAWQMDHQEPKASSGPVDANTVKEGRNCVSNHTSTLKSDLQTPAAPNACAHACTDIICPLNCKRPNILSSRRSRGRSPPKDTHTNNQLSINDPVRPSMSQCHPGKNEQTSV